MFTNLIFLNSITKYVNNRLFFSQINWNSNFYFQVFQKLKLLDLLFYNLATYHKYFTFLNFAKSTKSFWILPKTKTNVFVPRQITFIYITRKSIKTSKWAQRYQGLVAQKYLKSITETLKLFIFEYKFASAADYNQSKTQINIYNSIKKTPN